MDIFGQQGQDTLDNVGQAVYLDIIIIKKDVVNNNSPQDEKILVNNESKAIFIHFPALVHKTIKITIGMWGQLEGLHVT